jgi:hypothetical protein
LFTINGSSAGFVARITNSAASNPNGLYVNSTNAIGTGTAFRVDSAGTELLTVNGTGLAVTGNLSATGAVTLSGGTANGVAYLNGSKVLTTGSALTYNGTSLSVQEFQATSGAPGFSTTNQNTNAARAQFTNTGGTLYVGLDNSGGGLGGPYTANFWHSGNYALVFGTNNVEQMRLTSSGLEIKQSQLIGYSSYAGIGTNGLAVAGNLGIGTSSPAVKLDITGNDRLVRLNATSSNALIRYSLSGVAKFSEGLNDPSGWILYDDAASAYRLLVDYSGNLGVGSVLPGAKLDVAGNALLSGSSGYKYLYFNTSTEGSTVRSAKIGKNYDSPFELGIWSSTHSAGNATATVFYRDLTTESMRLDASGNLGIGTSSPLAGMKLDVAGLVAIGPIVATSGLGGNIRYRDDTSTQRYAVGILGTAAETAFSIYDVVNSAERVRLTSTGNLGIGTSSPGTKLDVQGSVPFARVKDNSTGYLGFRAENNSGNFYFGIDSSTGGFYGSAYARVLYSDGAYPMAFFTNATERMRLDSSGNLLVGTTALTATPISGHVLALAGTAAYHAIGHATGTPTGDYYATFSYNGTLIGSITQSGTTAVLYNLTSDQRLKTNIVDAAPASALIDAIQVRQFDWKSDGSHQRYGFIAQELVIVAPEAVHAPANPDEMMAVDYSKLVPLLVKELQSLRARVAQLESKP